MKTSSVAVLIPVLNRPARVRPVVQSLASTEVDPVTLPLRPIFICSPHDRQEIKAVRREGLEPIITDFEPGPGDYARKMNLGFTLTTQPWVFLGADDLHFTPGWIEQALYMHARTEACVIGTNDAGNRRTMEGRHSTHTLVHRDYGVCGVIDDPTRLLCEQYDHNFVDDEFVQTAAWRGTFAHARRSVVEHLHPNWNKAADDATYRKGMAHFDHDRRLYRTRRALWGGTEHL